MASSDHIDTLIGAQAVFEGSLRNSGSITIHGTVRGDVHSEATVTVGESAVVQGPIHAAVIDVSGKVEGSLQATERIELQPKSSVVGDMATAQLSIKPGASFIGQSKMMHKEGAAQAPTPELLKRRSRE